MTAPVVCTDQITVLTNNDIHCSGDWTVYESDLLEFASLLTFDLGLFGILMTTCAVLFITGYSAGLAVRQMGRV